MFIIILLVVAAIIGVASFFFIPGLKNKEEYPGQSALRFIIIMMIILIFLACMILGGVDIDFIGNLD